MQSKTQGKSACVDSARVDWFVLDKERAKLLVLTLSVLCWTYWIRLARTFTLPFLSWGELPCSIFFKHYNLIKRSINNYLSVTIFKDVSGELATLSDLVLVVHSDSRADFREAPSSYYKLQLSNFAMPMKKNLICWSQSRPSVCLSVLSSSMHVHRFNSSCVWKI